MVLKIFKSVILIGVLPILLLNAIENDNGLSKAIQKKINKELKIVFKDQETRLLAYPIVSEIKDSLDVPFELNNFFEILDIAENKIGFAYVGSAPSRADRFDYLILFDPDFFIIRSKVLIYREDYGGEIGSRRWLRQFEGKSFNTQFKVNDDIIPISGATISVNAMTKATNDVLASIKKLIEKGILK